MLRKTTAAALVIVLMLAVAACGGGGSSSSPVERFIANHGDEIMEELLDSMGGYGRAYIEAGAGNNEIVLTFHLNYYLGESGIEVLFDMMDDMFEYLADVIADEMGVNRLSLTVRFYDVEQNFGQYSYTI